MEISPNASITAPISFEEAWAVLSVPVQAMLAHLHRAEEESQQQARPCPTSIGKHPDEPAAYRVRQQLEAELPLAKGGLVLLRLAKM